MNDTCEDLVESYLAKAIGDEARKGTAFENRPDVSVPMCERTAARAAVEAIASAPPAVRGALLRLIGTAHGG